MGVSLLRLATSGGRNTSRSLVVSEGLSLMASTYGSPSQLAGWAYGCAWYVLCFFLVANISCPTVFLFDVCVQRGIIHPLQAFLFAFFFFASPSTPFSCGIVTHFTPNRHDSFAKMSVHKSTFHLSMFSSSGDQAPRGLGSSYKLLFSSFFLHRASKDYLHPLGLFTTRSH